MHLMSDVWLISHFTGWYYVLLASRNRRLIISSNERYAPISIRAILNLQFSSYKDMLNERYAQDVLYLHPLKIPP